MKYTIDINQKSAFDLGMVDILDIVDLSIFAAFRDFANGTRCEKMMVGKKVYFWIAYDLIIYELPFCRIKTKDGVYRRMKNLEAANIIEFHPDNQKMGKSFFCWGANYDAMISQTPTDKKPEGVRMKNRRGTDEKPDNHYTNHYTNNNTAVSEKETVCAFTFIEFWKTYGYAKGSKAKAEASFKKLSVCDKQEISETLPLYLHDTVTSDILRGEHFRPMRKYPEFYLSGKIWKTYVDIAAQRKKQNEQTLPEWTDAYGEYLNWVKRKFENILQSAKYLSKQQYAAYRTEFYVQGKSFIGEERERKELIKAHEAMNDNTDIMNKYIDVFAFHCERIKLAVKEYQI